MVVGAQHKQFSKVSCRVYIFFSFIIVYNNKKIYLFIHKIQKTLKKVQLFFKTIQKKKKKTPIIILFLSETYFKNSIKTM